MTLRDIDSYLQTYPHHWQRLGFCLAQTGHAWTNVWVELLRRAIPRGAWAYWLGHVVAVLPILLIWLAF